VTTEDVERIVAAWQSRLGLSHWDIKVRWEKPCEPDSQAQIVISEDYDQASVRIQQVDDPNTNSQPFTEWSDRVANVVVVHELLHCVRDRDAEAVVGARERSLEVELRGVLVVVRARRRELG
jgi:hypothetical protein